jgi:hypothetical protein
LANNRVNQNQSQNPDPQLKVVSGDDINPSQEQQTLPESLTEWWVRINHVNWHPTRKKNDIS